MGEGVCEREVTLSVNVNHPLPCGNLALSLTLLLRLPASRTPALVLIFLFSIKRKRHLIIEGHTACKVSKAAAEDVAYQKRKNVSNLHVCRSVSVSVCANVGGLRFGLLSLFSVCLPRLCRSPQP